MHISMASTEYCQLCRIGGRLPLILFNIYCGVALAGAIDAIQTSAPYVLNKGKSHFNGQYSVLRKLRSIPRQQLHAKHDNPVTFWAHAVPSFPAVSWTNNQSIIPCLVAGGHQIGRCVGTSLLEACTVLCSEKPALNINKVLRSFVSSILHNQDLIVPTIS